MSKVQRNRGWPGVTLVDVAREAGVSDATVSRVINGSDRVSEVTRRKVLDAIERTSFVRNGAARQLAGSLTKTVGLLLRAPHNPSYGLLHTRLQGEAAARGLVLLTVAPQLTAGPEEEVSGLNHLLEQRVSAIIVATGIIPPERFLPFAQRVPTLHIGRPLSVPGISSVAYDMAADAHVIADQVAEAGHRDVGVIVTRKEVSNAEHMRSTAVVDRLRARGLDPVMIDASSLDGAARESSTARALLLVQQSKVSAVVFPNDERALRFWAAANDAGVSIPEDCSITGHDGVATGLGIVGLATIRIPVEFVAARAIEILATQIADDQPVSSVSERYKGTFVSGRSLARLDSE